jgi:hypothetical protein
MNKSYNILFLSYILEFLFFDKMSILDYLKISFLISCFVSLFDSEYRSLVIMISFHI